MSTDLEKQYSNDPLERAYAVFKEGTCQAEICAAVIADSLSNQPLGKALEVGAADCRGAQALVTELSNHANTPTQYTVTDMAPAKITEAKSALAGMPNMQFYESSLDWTNPDQRESFFAAMGKPDTIVSLYNLFLMGATDITKKAKSPEELKQVRAIQKQALKDMTNSANQRVLLVQADPDSPLYKIQERALALVGRSLNCPMMSSDEINQIVTETALESGQKISLDTADIGTESQNYLTLNETQMREAVLFLLGVLPNEIIDHEGKSINLYAEWISLLKSNNWYNEARQEFKIPIHDRLYVIKKEAKPA